MCVILLCKKDARPDYMTLKKCQAANSDGIGVVWRTPEAVYWKKGLTLEELVPELDRPGSMMIHFRWASAGGVSPFLCHPFPIGGGLKLEGKAPVVIAHNGHVDTANLLKQFAGVRLDGPVSDTRIIARLIADKGVNLIRKVPGMWVAFGNKFTQKTGKWDQVAPGILASNLFWQNPSYRHYAEYGEYIGYSAPRHSGYTSACSVPAVTPAVATEEKGMKKYTYGNVSAYDYDEVEDETDTPTRGTPMTAKELEEDGKRWLAKWEKQEEKRSMGSDRYDGYGSATPCWALD